MSVIGSLLQQTKTECAYCVYGHLGFLCYNLSIDPALLMMIAYTPALHITVINVHPHLIPSECLVLFLSTDTVGQGYNFYIYMVS